MAKRTATSDLNHENWDREDAAEDAGTFSKASEEMIKKRVIKVAKRRNPAAMAKNEEGSTVFAGFTFAKTTNTSSNTFGCFSNLSDKESKTNGTTTTSSDKNNTDDYYAKLKGLNESVLSWISKKVNENPLINLQPVFKDYEKYFDELEKSRPLGDESTTEKTVENKDNPTFNFGTGSNVKLSSATPSFGSSATATSCSTSQGNTVSLSFGDKPTVSTSFMFGKKSDKPEEKSETSATPKTSGFSFLSSTKNPAQTSSTIFGATSPKEQQKLSFGPTPTTTSPLLSDKISFGSTVTASGSLNDSQKSSSGSGEMPKFSFGSGAMAATSSNDPVKFSFTSTSNNAFVKDPAKLSFGSSIASSSSDSVKNSQEDQEDEPPKNDFTPVVEKDYIHTVRCKVFVKKDGSYGDRGVGNLYLKKVPDSEKVQLIVRADTNLGNILCNFILSENIPMQKMGKRDVMLVCLPTPDTKPAVPVPILLRVKNTEEADDLLSVLKSHTK